MTGVVWDPLGRQGAQLGKQFVSRYGVNKVIDVQNSFFFSLPVFLQIHFLSVSKCYVIILHFLVFINSVTHKLLIILTVLRDL